MTSIYGTNFRGSEGGRGAGGSWVNTDVIRMASTILKKVKVNNVESIKESGGKRKGDGNGE